MPLGPLNITESPCPRLLTRAAVSACTRRRPAAAAAIWRTSCSCVGGKTRSSHVARGSMRWARPDMRWRTVAAHCATAATGSVGPASDHRSARRMSECEKSNSSASRSAIGAPWRDPSTSVHSASCSSRGGRGTSSDAPTPRRATELVADSTRRPSSRASSASAAATTSGDASSHSITRASTSRRASRFHKRARASRSTAPTGTSRAARRCTRAPARAPAAAATSRRSSASGPCSSTAADRPPSSHALARRVASSRRDGVSAPVGGCTAAR